MWDTKYEKLVEDMIRVAVENEPVDGCKNCEWRQASCKMHCAHCGVIPDTECDSWEDLKEWLKHPESMHGDCLAGALFVAEHHRHDEIHTFEFIMCALCFLRHLEAGEIPPCGNQYEFHPDPTAWQDFCDT
jgi:hypothetical protein